MGIILLYQPAEKKETRKEHCPKSYWLQELHFILEMHHKDKADTQAVLQKSLKSALTYNCGALM